MANSVGMTALHTACLWGNHMCVAVLIKAGARLNAQNNFSGATPLHYAAQTTEWGHQEGRVLSLTMLLKAGASPYIEDMRGKKAHAYSIDPDVRLALGGPADPAEETDPDEEYSDGYLPESQKTPVTIVTGFLGSGKTTLVNYILKEKHSKKIAVIENEFGSIDIDSSLISSNAQLAAKEDVISMDNGCVCCTVRGDFIHSFYMHTLSCVWVSVYIVS